MVSLHDEYGCASIHGLPTMGKVQMVGMDAMCHNMCLKTLRALQKYGGGVKWTSLFRGISMKIRSHS